MNKTMNIAKTLVAAAAGIALLHQGIITDMSGLALMAIVWFMVPPKPDVNSQNELKTN